MARSYYQTGGQRAEKVRRLFDAIARRYDLLNDLQSLGLHRIWKRKMMGMANRCRGHLALDLCCGTGDIAHALARRGWRVMGLDFSLPMLRIAQARTRRTGPPHEPAYSRWRAELRRRQRDALAWGWSRRSSTLHVVAAQQCRPTNQRLMDPMPLQALEAQVREDAPCRHPPQWILGDALSISAHDNSFDLVTIGYGLRNLSGIAAGLNEMHRVLKPGGRIMIQDFGKPPHRVWRTAYFAYLKNIVPLLGWLFCGDYQAYHYILESLEDYPAQSGVTTDLARAGFINITVRNFMGGVASIHSAEKP